MPSPRKAGVRNFPSERSPAVGQCQTVSAWGASSVVGLRRKSNQDRYFQQGNTFAVADGMGGLVGGAEASAATVQSIRHNVSELYMRDPLTKWDSLIRTVNRETRQTMLNANFQNAGSTLTVTTVEPERVVVAHVGDSRLYSYRTQTGELVQRTIDHNLQNELESQGRNLQDGAAHGIPLAALVSYIGMPDEELRIDVFSWSPEYHSRLLLCSDGVHGSLSDEEIADVLATFPSLQAAKELTQRADAAGGRDNSTALVLDL